jgi:O-antigen/teichoic acid export membrane protein
MSLMKNLSKDTVIYGVGTVIQRIIGFVLLPFYTRALSPSDYGILDTLTTLIFFIGTIFGLGLTGATSRYFFIAESEEEKKKLLYTSAIMRMISFSIPTLFLVVFSSRISVALFDTDEYSLVVLLTGFLLYFSTQQDIQSFIFRFYREPIKYNVVILLRAIIYPASGIILVVVLQWGVLGATLANLITSVVMLVFGYLYFVKNKYTREFSWYWAKKMLKFGLPLIFTGILTWVNSVSDRFFLLYYQDLGQIGLYSIGNTFSQPIQLINYALSMSSMVIIMSLYSDERDEDKPQTKALLTKIWYAYLVISISMALFISIFSYDIVTVLTTPMYIGSILAIPFLLFSQIIYFSVDLTGNGMTLREQSKPYVWIMLIAGGVNVGLNFYFIPNFGFVGAAITTLISNSVYFLIAYYWSQKVFFIKRSLIQPGIYLLLTLSIALFFPFYELKVGVNIHYLLKVLVFIVILTLPFAFKIIDYRQILNLLNTFKQKIKNK